MSMTKVAAFVLLSSLAIIQTHAGSRNQCKKSSYTCSKTSDCCTNPKPSGDLPSNTGSGKGREYKYKYVTCTAMRGMSGTRCYWQYDEKRENCDRKCGYCDDYKKKTASYYQRNWMENTWKSHCQTCKTCSSKSYPSGSDAGMFDDRVMEIIDEFVDKW